VICYCIQEEEEEEDAAAAGASAISWLFGSLLEGSDCFILIVSDVCSDKSAFLFCGFCFSPLWQEEEGTGAFEFLKEFWFFSQKHFWPRSGDRHLFLILVLSFRFCLLQFCMRKVCIFWCIDLTGRK
jgi:hypothetical protein